MEMEGGKETDSQATVVDDDSFVWDETSGLYFHASSGFYHDSNAGWYYSSRDGLYYKFENGSYVLLEFDKVNAVESRSSPGVVSDTSDRDESSTQFCCNSEDNVSSLPVDHCDAYSFSGTVRDEGAHGYTKCSSDQPAENPPPPSEWYATFLILKTCFFVSFNSVYVQFRLEESLINLYLSGYKQVGNNADVSTMSLEVDGGDGLTYLADGASNDDTQMLKDGDWITEHNCKVIDQCESTIDEGQVYKLHSPSARYLASLSSYDSSNPTKDWGVPELSMNIPHIPLTKSSGKSKPKLADKGTDCKGMFISSSQHSISKKQRIYEYRDRAAERRNFHGGFGVGPGQKSTLVDDVCSPVSTEEAAAEALDMSFGSGSYARKMLEKMGWKEGEGLGNTRKGLINPIQAVGNVGSAGLGWPRGRMTDC
ncbi:uncharacterized protein LOC110631225 isoform X5 [Manihot esculenta]|uniref:uncharacterized protein LOC110631225 isoform X5 n=1 Tax=Manihot esculenta TaxID=3983 RepID=UPI001CC7C8F1|nr:uncharacterized protein LOC110631225 isoform X5 [Manihot esculenta]